MKRIYHTWDKWECYPAGFYDDRPRSRHDASKDQLEREYADFLSNTKQFWSALERVITEWKNSCEHYLTNQNMNRIAWLGQASACISLGIPSAFRGGFHLMTKEQQQIADMTALAALNVWLLRNGHNPVSIEECASKTEANLY